MQSLNLAFVTCVQLGLSCMEELYRCGANLNLVITLPDHQAKDKSGRVFLDKFCDSKGIDLVKVSNINNSKIIDEVKSRKIDWLFIIGWSQIVHKELLEIPRLGALGMHPTLLPSGRGRAAIPWAILKDLQVTGVTLFKLDEGVDSGDIISQISIPIEKNTNAFDLYNKIELGHIKLINSFIPIMVSGEVKFTKQQHNKATFWPGRKPSDGAIDVNGSVVDAEKLVRAITKPYPGAFYYKNGRKIIVWEAHIPNENDVITEPFIVFKDGILVVDNYELDT